MTYMGSHLISVAYEVQGLLFECHTFFSIWTLVLSDCRLLRDTARASPRYLKILLNRKD